MAARRNAKPGETVRYIGANIGGYIPGVPLKDMDAEEWNALDVDLRVLAMDSGLYEMGDPDEAAEVKAAAQEDAVKAAPGKVEPGKAPKSDKEQKEG